MPLNKPAKTLRAMSKACFARTHAAGKDDAGCHRMAREATAKAKRSKKRGARRKGKRR